MGSDTFLVLEIQVLIHLILVQQREVLVTCLLVYGLFSNLLLRLI